MPTITFQNHDYELTEDETVLEGLLRQGVDYPHACRAGSCQSCLTCAEKGAVKQDWQQGLKPTLASRHYFLPCLAYADQNMAIALPGDDRDVTTKATIVELVYLSKQVVAVKLAVDDLNHWTPGCYINLINSAGVIRSYSIANQPYNEGVIELHIKLVPQGRMSEWLIHQAQAGAHVNIRGPIGDCFYCNPDNISFPLVLAGTGTGLAPLRAIALEALAQNHVGDIYLLHGGLTAADLYLDTQLKQLAQQYPQLHYRTCTLHPETDHTQMPIDQLLVDCLSDLSQPRVYLCGPDETIKPLKMKAFLAGVNSQHIVSDAFV